MTAFAPTRRLMLQLLASTAALPLLSVPATAQAAPAARLIVLSDLHSAYERSAQLLAAVAAELAADPAPAAILINGDVFELGNVVAARSAGAVDWRLLEKLARLAPSFLNIGNHEPDLINDPAEMVARARAAGLTVLSNILDKRTGAPFTAAGFALDLGPIPLALVGIATNAVNTYPKPTRELMTIPDPVAWAKASLAENLPENTLHVVMSHAGVVADRSILPLLGDGSLLIGGHDHLVLDHAEGRTRYVHTGSWSSLFTVIDIAADRTLSVRQNAVLLGAPADPELAALVAATLAQHLTAEEQASVGTSPEVMSLGQSARFVAAALARAGGGDVGFIGHTTFGTGLPEGGFSKYVFDSVVRFDGKLVRAEVDRPTLDAILGRTNQDGDLPLAARTGDFLYAAPTALADKERYVIVTNDWSASNQKTYFGRDDLVFTDIEPTLPVKATALAALQ